MCLMDDAFFNVCMDGSIECMQLILRIIMDKANLEVQEVITQRTIANIHYRGVRFDVMATAELAERTRYFKEDERGAAKMSPITKEIYDEGKVEMILEMLKDNYQIKIIAKISKFTIEKIKEIAKENNIAITE